MKITRNNRWLAVVALALAILVGGLDMTVLNLALPVLAKAFHATESQLQWFIDSYSLVMAAMLLLGGLLGDRFGRKKMILVSLTMFAIGSIACAYSGDSSVFIASRAFLGVGAAFLIPLSIGQIPVLFPDDAERSKAIAVLMGATIVGYPIGPILGGWLLTNFWWGWVFLMNVPVAIAAFVLLVLFLPESKSEKSSKIDVIGVITSGLGLAGLTYGIIEAGGNGWSGSPKLLLSMIGGAAMLLAFGMWEVKAKDPLIDFKLFGSGKFTWGTILSTLASFAMFGFMFTAPQYFQAVLGTDTMGAGIRLLPMIFGFLAGGVLSDRLSRTLGKRGIMATGFILMAAGFVMGAGTRVGTGNLFTIAWIATVGLGIGFAIPSSMDVAIGTLSEERSGIGSAVIMVVRTFGGTIGVAILGAVLNSVYQGGLHLSNLPESAAGAVSKSVVAGVEVARQLGSSALLNSVRSSFVSGMDAVLWISAGISAASVIMIAAFLSGKKPASANNTEK